MHVHICKHWITLRYNTPMQVYWKSKYSLYNMKYTHFVCIDTRTGIPMNINLIFPSLFLWSFWLCCPIVLHNKVRDFFLSPWPRIIILFRAEALDGGTDWEVITSDPETRLNPLGRRYVTLWTLFGLILRNLINSHWNLPIDSGDLVREHQHYPQSNNNVVSGHTTHLHYFHITISDWGLIIHRGEHW